MKQKNKDHIRFEKHYLPILRQLAKILLVEDFSPITLKYGVQDKEASAECDNSHPYKTIHIKYSDDLLKDFKEGVDVTATLVHEMCHPITDPLFNKATYRYVSQTEINEERERLTDHIANIVIKNKLIKVESI